MTRRQERAKTSNDLTELKELNASVEHTYKVIAKAQSIVAAAVDMETGMRGFLLAGQDQFLEPYVNGKNNFYQQMSLITLHRLHYWQKAKKQLIPGFLTLLRVKFNYEEILETPRQWTMWQISLGRQEGKYILMNLETKLKHSKTVNQA